MSLTTHVTSSEGWLGTAAAFQALAIAAVKASKPMQSEGSTWR
ncbi:MAG TPA: hypothetical protein VFH40_01490 [Gemmatimonadales bacterium]|nr:hypothetical protein [Gemmatimonadales bacterium]